MKEALQGQICPMMILQGSIHGEINLVGKMRQTVILRGTLREEINLIGQVSIQTEHEVYKGPHEFTPKIEKQIVETEDKVVPENIAIDGIPYYEVTNKKGGVTVIIGG